MSNNKNIISIAISVLILLSILFAVFKYFGKDKEVDKLKIEQAVSKAKYEDTLIIVRGQLDLQIEKVTERTDRVIELENSIDSLLAKHKITKTKVRPAPFPTADSNHAMLVPTEYVDECETCFNKLQTYKVENVQLRFERDSYDTIMRKQSEIQSNRIQELEIEKIKFAKLFATEPATSTENTRKLKMSGAGMFNNLFSPKAGGFGLIYEDKKFNEFGGHVLFSNDGEIYIFHVAKTISLRRKR